MEQKNSRVVVLTDSGEEIDWLRSRLKDAGFSPFCVVNEEDLLEAASMPGVGLFLLMGETLERVLPEILFGISASRAATAPVVVLARSRAVLETPRVSVFDVDDFLVSPWRPEDVIARVSALCGKKSLRRNMKPQGLYGFQLVRSRLAIAYASREAIMTPSEFEIARVLVRYLDTPVSRQQMPQGPRRNEEQGASRSLDALVSRVRKKLESIVAGEFRVRSLYGVGYTLERAHNRRGE
ncbi:MAG: winged helix-turn-helix domain-containing protein [Variovorax sp.]|nr:winged helix-turn-helix domain-containing protein [Variovorax sp.]